MLDKNHPLIKRKWQVFLRQKRARTGIIVFSLIFLLSMAANFVSNSKPIFLIRDSKVFFPALFHYNPKDLGLINTFVIDYKKLVLKDHADGKNTFVIFPPNKWNAEEQTDDSLAPPSKDHWLGTDNLGRDVLARLIYGTRISLSFALLLWIISYSTGVVIGAMQGYFFGAFDFILERLKELAAIIPMLTMIILVTAITRSQSFATILFLVLIFGWMGMASQIRASVLSLRKREFCDAAMALGGSHTRILMKHILPNSLTAVITLAPLPSKAEFHSSPPSIIWVLAFLPPPRV